MEIERKDSLVILRPNPNFGGKQMITISDFHNELVENLSNFKTYSLIVDLSNNINADLKEILLFSQIGKELKNNNQSFVIVYDNVDIDHLPDDLVMVPTLKEAEDIIELENMERDLGF
jgi:hypothetical protein